MNQDKGSGFLEKVGDGLLDELARCINQRLREAIPKGVDRFFEVTPKVVALICNKTTEAYRILKQKKTKAEQLTTVRDNAPDNVDKLEAALKKYETNVNDKEAQKELVEALSVEISKNSLLWESLDLFTRDVECPYCKKSITEYWEDYVYGESTCERDMGTETYYTIECDDFLCPNCKKPFSVKGYICTYPDGIYNSHRLEPSAVHRV